MDARTYGTTYFEIFAGAPEAGALILDLIRLLPEREHRTSLADVAVDLGGTKLLWRWHDEADAEDKALVASAAEEEEAGASGRVTWVVAGASAAGGASPAKATAQEFPSLPGGGRGHGIRQWGAGMFERVFTCNRPNDRHFFASKYLVSHRDRDKETETKRHDRETNI